MCLLTETAAYAGRLIALAAATCDVSLLDGDDTTGLFRLFHLGHLRAR